MNTGLEAGSAFRLREALPFPVLRVTLPDMPQANDMTDAELMQRYREGDAAAFDTLYSRHRLAVFSFLLKHSGRDRAEVDEVFQECWLKVIRRRDQYDTAQPFLPWLYTIARHCLVDRWRHLGRVESIHVASDAAMLGASSNGLARPERRAASELIEQRWQEALASLPAVQREAVLLHFETDMTLEDIAAATGTQRETVKSRLRYAMNKLRTMLADLYAEADDELA